MNTLIKILVTVAINIAIVIAQGDRAYDITVNVEDIESNDGKVFLALYNSESSFLDKTYKGTISKIENNKCTVEFKDVPPGTYAVSIFHDENDNGKMDSNFMGIPKEDYGCSNNAKGFMGPPKWKDAKFQLKEDTSITITL